MQTLPFELIHLIYYELDLISIKSLSMTSHEVRSFMPRQLIEVHRRFHSVMKEIRTIEYYVTFDRFVNMYRRFSASIRIVRGNISKYRLYSILNKRSGDLIVTGAGDPIKDITFQMPFDSVEFHPDYKFIDEIPRTIIEFLHVTPPTGSEGRCH